MQVRTPRHPPVGTTGEPRKCTRLSASDGSVKFEIGVQTESVDARKDADSISTVHKRVSDRREPVRNPWAGRKLLWMLEHSQETSNAEGKATHEIRPGRSLT